MDHARYRAWLDGVVSGDEAYGMSPQVLCSVARIATHPRIYVSPSRFGDAIAFARVLLEQPHRLARTTNRAGVLRPRDQRESVCRDRDRHDARHGISG